MSSPHRTFLPNLVPFSPNLTPAPAATFWESATQPRPLVFDLPNFWSGPLEPSAYIEKHYGHLVLSQMRGSYGLVVRPNHQDAMAGRDKLTLGGFLEQYRQGVKLPYLTHMSIKRNFPDMAEFFHLPEALTDNWIDGRFFTRLPEGVRTFLDDLGGAELFIGQAGQGFGPVHVDFMAVHVIFVQLSGEKRFVLFPPSDGKYLYPTRGRMFPFQLHYTQVDILDPELLQRWPLVAKTSPMSVLLKPGQCLMLPANWWHTTVNETDGMTFCSRLMNRTNVGLTARECLLGVPRTALRLLGR